ncbi:sphingomyelin synthase 1, putative [Plasmodium chabaudi chabaudi]|uniref:Sphingomyelin synthase 1, putative n=1 Tax=Plasmodium chabaudi chabaudi TaxID=31271 RepID=A0A1D3RY74_PLACU|nr:sphingomyelin synthase 1, putative [Plasmodium chabaudi chabaudi]
MRDLRVIDSSNINYGQNEEEEKRVNNVYLQVSTHGASVDIEKGGEPIPQNILDKKFIYNIFYIRTLYAIIFFTVGVFIQCYFIILSDEHYNTGETPLKDRMHELFKKPDFMTQQFVNSSILSLMWISFLRFGLFSPALLAITMFIRTALILGFIYATRSIFIYCTTIPCPVSTCQPVVYNGFLQNLYTIYLIIVAKVYECTDLIISGHTCFTTLFLLIWLYYEKNVFLRLAVFLYSTYLYLLIIISRFHYSVDVLLGICYGSTVFIFYHWFLDIAAKRYVINKSFCSKHPAFKGPFSDRNIIINYFIQIIGYMEGLNYRLDIAMHYDKELSTFCPCKPVNSQALIIPNNSGTMESYVFSEHFYHSYAGDGSFDLSTIKYFVRKFKLFTGIIKDD